MKLNLNFGLYKGKTRLSSWWKNVKDQFTAVQEAVNNLDETGQSLAAAISAEAAERERADGEIREGVSAAAAAIEAETAERQSWNSHLATDINNAVTEFRRADTALDEKIDNEISRSTAADNQHDSYLHNLDTSLSRETETRAYADEAIKKSKLSFYDFGVYSAANKTVENSNANEHYSETLEAIGCFDTGSIIRFVVDTDCGEVNIPVVLYDGYLNEKVAHINISHSFTGGHTYTARVADAPHLGSKTGPHTNYYGIDGTAEIISDNGISVGAAAAISAERAAREAAESAVKADITSLRNISHSHANQSVIDSITENDVALWRGLESQVTREQLDNVYDFFAECIQAVDLEMQNVYAAIGCKVYDGGLFGACCDGDELSGGEFGESETEITDCGGFEEFVYAGSNVSGNVIDGGIYP